MATNYPNVSYENTGLEENVGIIKHDIKQESSNLEKISHMSDFMDRLASFTTWPDDVITSAVDLADCGFYHTGYNDEVVCFKCNVRLKDWQDDDSPYDRHIDGSPHCEYLALRPLQHKHKEKKIEVKTNLTKSENKSVTVKSNTDAFNIIGNQNATGVQNTDWYTPKHEHPSKNVDYLVEANRYASFVGRWPIDSPLNPDDMVRAGLYYVGPDDKVQCAWCRGRMYNWETDDSPISEHARYFPKCPFVINKMHEKINFPTQTSVVPQHGSTESNEIQDMPAVYIVKEMGYELDIIKKALGKWRSNASSSSDGKISVEKLLDNIFEIENEANEVLIDGDTDPTRIFETPTDNTNKSCLLESEKLDNKELVKKLQHENESLKGKTLCKICLDNEVDMLLLPCRHLVCCSKCGNAVTQCPMCRTVIVGTVNTYLS